MNYGVGGGVSASARVLSRLRRVLPPVRHGPIVLSVLVLLYCVKLCCESAQANGHRLARAREFGSNSRRPLSAAT